MQQEYYRDATKGAQIFTAALMDIYVISYCDSLIYYHLIIISFYRVKVENLTLQDSEDLIIKLLNIV